MIMATLPGLVTPLKSRFIVSVACGDFHTLALEQNGHLWAWGGGVNASFNKGQCGLGHNENVPKA